MPFTFKADPTKRQTDILDFIRECIADRGYGPTVREIGKRFNISSPNGVMGHLKALEKKGMISREHNLARAIHVGTPPTPIDAAKASWRKLSENEKNEFSEWLIEN